MSNPDPSLERRLDELYEQVRRLSARVDELTSRVRAVSGVESPPADSFGAEGDHTASVAPTGPQLTPQIFLSGMATLCFILVVALILRTIVDKGVINERIGSVSGMCYAGLVICYGFYRYSKAYAHAPLFVSCGALLLFSIVFETHARFQLLSAPLAYATLTVTLTFMTVLGLRYGVVTPLCVGTLGATVAGMALEFPDPFFPCLAVLLLFANAASYATIRIPSCRWLIWSVLVITLFFWLMWTTKLRVSLSRGQELTQELALQWFLPCLFFFVIMYAAMVIWSVLRAGWSFGFLEMVLPIVNVVWAYAAAKAVVLPWHGREDLVGTAGVLAALAHIGLALWFATMNSKGVRPATSFIAAGLILLALSLPACVGNILISLLIWAFAALCTGVISGIWQNRAVRVTSYLFQVFACVAAVVSGSLCVLVPLLPASVTALVLLCLICLAHYSWCHSRALKPGDDYLPLTYLADRTIALLLCAAMTYAFGACRIVLFATLALLQVKGEAVFQCGQSILINFGALLLAIVGLILMNNEVLALAVLVALVGASKVFGYDLLNFSGLPVVLSVLSFGITAAAGSLLWGRRQRRLS